MLLSVSGLSINSKYGQYLVTKRLKMSLFLVHVTGLLACPQSIRCCVAVLYTYLWHCTNKPSRYSILVECKYCASVTAAVTSVTSKYQSQISINLRYPR